MNRIRKGVAEMSLLAALVSPCAAQDGEREVAAAPVLNVTDLDGSNGFVINGLNPRDNFGFSVASAGDVNGDGIGDLIIGAAWAHTDDTFSVGRTWVIFGGRGLGDTGVLDLAALDGTNGFVINGAESLDSSGWSVCSAGDVNADGVDDLLIGTPIPSVDEMAGVGKAYLVFGSEGIGHSGAIELSELDGTSGVTFTGIEVGHRSGASVASTGDINGDGISDFIIGTPGDHSDDALRSSVGCVVFGSQALGDPSVFPLSTLDGRNGFAIEGIQIGDECGASVGSAGDLNADGFADLILGAEYAEVEDRRSAGKCFVVFGGSTVGNTGILRLSELDGVSGFEFQAAGEFDFLGRVVASAGDINADGIDDIVVSAEGADVRGTDERTGASYVVFGGETLENVTTWSPGLINAATGFAVDGRVLSVSGLGDFNGDGNDDVAISRYGSVRVLFGGTAVAQEGIVVVDEMLHGEGLVISNEDGDDYFGNSISSAGDINADGIDDLIIGAESSRPEGRERAGAAYVIFGRRD